MFRNIRFSRKIIVMTMLASLMISFGVSGVYAYLTSSDSLSGSVMFVGGQESEIVEVWDPPEEIVAGEEYEKVVTVKNTGSSDCFVRVFAEFEDPNMAEAIDVDFNTTDWSEKQDDGYYYYNKVLKGGESTEPLFTTLSAKGDLSDLRLIVYCETIQTSGYNNAIDAFASYK